MHALVYIMKITSAILWFMVMSIFGSVCVAAEEKDPFFPAGPRSVETSSVPRDSEWGRDPFSRPFEGTNKPAPTPGARGLTGIICSKITCLAIIGGETYRLGSMMNGQRLVEIRRRSVVLKNSSGTREEMFLEEFSIKK
jgi:hypothetical protein